MGVNPVKLLVWALLFFSTITYSQQVFSSEELCRAAVSSTVDAQNITANSLTPCSSTPMKDDLAVQLIGFLVGDESMSSAFYLLSFLDGDAFGTPPSQPSNGLTAPLHSVLFALNMILFGCVVLQALSGAWVDVAKFSAIDRTLQLKKWMHLHGVNYGLAMILTYPIFGWMTILHYLALNILLLLLSFSKPLIGVLFVLSQSSATQGAWVDKLYPVYESELSNTAKIYKCDLNRRDQILRSLTLSIGRKESELQKSGLFQCLQSSQGVSRLVGDPSSVSMSLQLSSVDQTSSCLEQNKAEVLQLGLSNLSACGQVSILLPSSSYKPSAEAAFVSPSMHLHVRKIAAGMFEYECRSRLNAKSEQQFSEQSIFCFSQSVNGDSYKPQWVSDPSTNERLLAVWAQGMSNADVFDLKKEILQEKRMAAQLLMSSSQGLFKMSQSQLGASDENKGSNTNHTVDDLTLKVRKGGLMLGSLFFDNPASEVVDQQAFQMVAAMYRAIPAEQTQSSDESGLLDDFNAQPQEGILLSSLSPSLKLFESNRMCWNDNSMCLPVVTNPFSDMIQEGRRLIGESMLYYMGAKLIGYAAKQLQSAGSSPIMAVEVFNLVYGLYLFMGVVLFVIIPAYAFFAFFGVLVVWLYDFCRAGLVVQINLAMSSPELPHKSIFSPKTEESFLQMIGVGIYFGGIIFGVLLFLLTMSFFYSIDAFVMGWLYETVSWAGSAHSIEAMVFRVIFDAVLVGILFYQTKLSVPLLQQIPVMVLQRFELSMSTTESIGETVLANFRRHILPSVAQFLSR